MHIGSGPGVAGLSGMQVKPFVPLRSVRILPSASMATIVAFLPTAAGAALIALLIMSASARAALAAGFGVSAAFADSKRLKDARIIIAAEVAFVHMGLPPLIHRCGSSKFCRRSLRPSADIR